MQHFESGLPHSFNAPLKKMVTTMSVNKKQIHIGKTPVVDTELIYSRIIGLQQSRELNVKDILQYELSAVPPALFEDNGDMRSQSKSTLKAKLQVTLSARLITPPDAIIIDGCAMMWSVHWPVNGTVKDYINNFVTSLQYYLDKCRVHLIFDRYHKECNSS